MGFQSGRHGGIGLNAAHEGADVGGGEFVGGRLVFVGGVVSVSGRRADADGGGIASDNAAERGHIGGGEGEQGDVGGGDGHEIVEPRQTVLFDSRNVVVGRHIFLLGAVLFCLVSGKFSFASGKFALVKEMFSFAKAMFSLVSRKFSLVSRVFSFAQAKNEGKLPRNERVCGAFRSSYCPFSPTSS